MFPKKNWFSIFWILKPEDKEAQAYNIRTPFQNKRMHPSQEKHQKHTDPK